MREVDSTGLSTIEILLYIILYCCIDYVSHNDVVGDRCVRAYLLKVYSYGRNSSPTGAWGATASWA